VSEGYDANDDDDDEVQAQVEEEQAGQRADELAGFPKAMLL